MGNYTAPGRVNNNLNNLYSQHMKRIIFLFAFFVVTCAIHAQRVNDKVEIEYSGSWYTGKILKVEGDRYFVTYEGWSDSWDEWVPLSRLRNFQHAVKTGAYQVGDRVEVEYGIIPEPATVIEVGENKYHIKYDNSLFGTRWVSESQIKKL